MKKVLLILLAIIAISCTETELLTPPNTEPIELKDVDIQAKQVVSLKKPKNTAKRTVGSGCLSPSHNTINDTCSQECQPTPISNCTCPPEVLDHNGNPEDVEDGYCKEHGQY